MNRFRTLLGPVPRGLLLLGIGTTLASAAPQAIQAFGLDHTPLGIAQLTPAGGALVVSNIGSSGLDGVRIDLGQSEFHIIRFDTPPLATLQNASIEIDAVLVGTAENMIALNQNQAGDAFELSQGSMLAGAGPLIVESVLAGQVIDSVTYGIAPAPGTTLAIFAPDGCRVDPIWPMDDECWTLLEFTSDVPVALTGSVLGPQLADGVILRSLGWQGSAPVLTATTIEVANIPQITLLDESLGLFGLPHKALGQTALTAQAGQLTVSNIGSSGLDGVSIDLGDVSTHTITFDPNQSAAALSDGTYMDFTTTGVLSSVPDQEIWTLRIEDVGTEFGVSLDTTIVQSGSLRVDVLSSGVVVDSQVLTPQLSLGNVLVKYPPMGCRVDPFLPLAGQCLAAMEMAAPVPITITGHAAVIADAVHIVSFGQQQTVGSLSRTDIRVGGPPGGIDSFIICDNELGWIFAHATEIYCTGKVNSLGCVAAIATSNPAAVPASGANDYDITCSDVVSLKPGLLIGAFGAPAAIPFQGGTLCIQPPLKRGPIMNSSGAPISCTGTYSTRINNGQIVPVGLDAGPGNTGWYQYWYRDPANSFGTALSNAVEVPFF